MSNNKLDLVQTQFVGLQQRLQRTFNLNTQPLFTISNDPVPQLAQRVKQSEKIKYPICYMMPRSFAEAQNAYPAARMAKSPYGVIYGVGPDDTLLEMRIIPVDLTVEFFYLTDDPLAFLSFGSNWMHASKSGDLNFQLDWYGNSIDIQVASQPDLAIPEKDMMSDTLDTAAAQGTIMMHGYAQKIIRADPTLRGFINQDQIQFEMKDYFQLDQG